MNDLKGLYEMRNQLEAELMNIEKNIFDLETHYMEETNSYGILSCPLMTRKCDCRLQ